MKNSIRKVEYSFESTKIKKDVTFALLADLHNKRYGENNSLLLKEIKASKVDFILLAGDMVVCRNKQIEESIKTADTILEMSKLAPVYYGIGNHEGGIRNGSHETGNTWDRYIEILHRDSNIHVLENRHVLLTKYNMNIYGLDLPAKHYVRFIKHELKKADIEGMLGKFDKDSYNLMIAHHPDYFKEYCMVSPDLIVSGHNHGGMVRLPILGGVISPRLHPFPKYDYGLYEKESTKMIVTSGAGLHSINMRINNPPELVVIHIKKINI